MKKNRPIFTHILLTLILFFPFFAYGAEGDIVDVSLSPKIPGEYERVTLTINSFATDLDSSEIIWFVNKNPLKEGVGEKKISLSTGKFGEKTIVDITILTPSGQSIYKQFILAPSEIDFLWEAETYVPPFYKGKALPTYKSNVKVTALPRYNSAESNPKKFSYEWKRDLNTRLGQGLGRDSVRTSVGYADTPTVITLLVTGNEDNWKANTQLDIVPTETRTTLYPFDPLLGVGYNNALTKNVRAPENTYNIRATPYFFSIEDFYSDTLVYTWKVNNQNVIAGFDPNLLTIGTSDAFGREFSVSLKVQSPKHILQKSEVATNIILPNEN